MKLGTFCNWNIPVAVWFLSWTGRLTRQHMKKQKTELPPCASVGGTNPMGHSMAHRPQHPWTTHLGLLSIKDISSQYWSGHISSKWHFVNRQRRKKILWFLCLQGLALEVLGFIFFFLLVALFLFICLNEFTAAHVGCGWLVQTLYAPLASQMLAEMLWACVTLAWQHFQCHC